MKIHCQTFLLCCLCAFALSSCGGPDVSRTHRGDVIDDKVTTQRVQAALTQAGSQFKNVHVETRDGVVMLTGSVNSDENRTQAETIARGVHREMQLENDIQVQQ
jgi:osmotically-inducible protein OsmY